MYRSLPSGSDEPMGKLLHSKILFTNVLLLSPPQHSDLYCDYGSALIFHYATEDAQIMVDANGEQERSRFYTSRKVLHVAFMAQ